MESKLVRGTNENKTIKVAVVYAPEVVEEAGRIHQITPTATVALGWILIAGFMTVADMRNQKDAPTIHVDEDSPLGKILVTGKSDGQTKGYVQNPQANRDLKANGKLDVSDIVGSQGVTTVVMDLGLKEFYVGRVSLLSGETADDFANYFVQSDQVPPVVALGVLAEKDRTVKTAGGLIMQMIPGVAGQEVDQVEGVVKKTGSVTDYFKTGKGPEDLTRDLLEGQGPEILESHLIAYTCNCSKEKVEDSLLSLGHKELEEIQDQGGQAEITCYLYNEAYHFDGEDLDRLIKKSKNIDKE